MDIKTRFESDAEKREYVKNCEESFTKSVEASARILCEDNSLRFITLSGPTCSGKTTAAGILVDEMEARGKTVGVISIDDFYFDRSFLNSRGTLDYDSVDTIDIEFLKSVIRDIGQGKDVDLPVYSFISGKREGYRKYNGNGRITLFEGIQAIYPEVRSLFDDSNTKSIYISVADGIALNGVDISGRELRLFRRIVRDFKKRSTTPEFTFKLWKTVVANEDRSILPYENECDCKINSFMGYELSMIKEPLLKLLETIDENSAYYEYAQNIKRIFDGVCALSADYLPENSLYREFVG